jgi:hypothetical protein
LFVFCFCFFGWHQLYFVFVQCSKLLSIIQIYSACLDFSHLFLCACVA